MAEDENDAPNRRGRILLTVVVLAALTVGGRFAWRNAVSRVAADERYRITAENLELPEPPAWVRGSVRDEALTVAAQHGPLSMLDPPERLATRLADAFAFHPWVRTVDRIEKLPPNRVRVDLTYRRPLAAIAGAPTLLLVDTDAVRLPEQELTNAELRHLPRITLPPASGSIGQPLLGEPWRDPRVLGGVSLITALSDAWWNLRLADVVPRSRPEVRGSERYFLYDLVSTHGTRIAWGAAPSAQPHDEPPFDLKLSRLIAYVQSHGTLESVHSPAVVDVRYRTRVEQRNVEKPSPSTEDETVLK